LHWYLLWSPYSPLILLIWVFSFFLIWLVKGISILFIFLKSQLFVSLFLCVIFCLDFIDFGLVFISSCLLVFYLSCSYFSKSLRCIIRLFACSVFLMYVLKAIHCPSALPFLYLKFSYRLCFHFHWFLGTFWFSPLFILLPLVIQ
jgi:hypothetical protein